MQRGLYILIILANSICIAYGQDPNTSFVYSDFTTFTSMSISSITSTDDGGFAYVKSYQPWTFEMLENNKLRYVNIDLKLYQSKNRDMENVPCVLFKVSKYGTIQFVNLLGKRIGGSYIKQTKDQGYIIAGFGNLTKLNKQGGTQWQIFFNNDSILGVKKSRFLSDASISSITECNDGSFIALFSASFSLLKISKDGKPLWLKSTVFKEFDPYVFKFFSNQLQDIVKKDSISINWFSHIQGGGVYIPTYQVYETNDGGYMALGKNNYRYKALLHDYADTNKVSYVIKQSSTTKIEGRTPVRTVVNERIAFKNDKKVYGFGKPAVMTAADSLGWMQDGTTCVVKTDRDGNMEWTRQFGNYSWSGSMLSSSRSDLLKLSGGRYLVRIRDCAPGEKDNFGDRKWVGAGSRFFMINEKGENVWNGGDWLNPFQCDPRKLILAADSGYFCIEEGLVTKYDKQFKPLWSHGTKIRSADWINSDATYDSGFICSAGGGYILKLNKNGDSPVTDIKIYAQQDEQSLILSIDTKSLINNNTPYYLEIYSDIRKKKKLIKMVAGTGTLPNEIKDGGENYIKVNPGENGILDLNKLEQLETAYIDLPIDSEGKKYRILVAHSLDGYRRFEFRNLPPGKYVYVLYPGGDKKPIRGKIEISTVLQKN